MKINFIFFKQTKYMDASVYNNAQGYIFLF